MRTKNKGLRECAAKALGQISFWHFFVSAPGSNLNSFQQLCAILFRWACCIIYHLCASTRARHLPSKWVFITMRVSPFQADQWSKKLNRIAFNAFIKFSSLLSKLSGSCFRNRGMHEINWIWKYYVTENPFRYYFYPLVNIGVYLEHCSCGHWTLKNRVLIRAHMRVGAGDYEMRAADTQIKHQIERTRRRVSSSLAGSE